MAGAVVGNRVRRSGGGRPRRLDREVLRHGDRWVDGGDYQCAGVRCGHQLRTAADIALPGRIASQHISSARLADRGAPGPAGDHRQQRHRGVGAADIAAGFFAEHSKSRGAGRIGTGGGRRLCRAGVAAGACPIRPKAVLALHSQAGRQGGSRPVVSDRRSDVQPCPAGSHRQHPAARSFSLRPDRHPGGPIPD